MSLATIAGKFADDAAKKLTKGLMDESNYLKKSLAGITPEPKVKEIIAETEITSDVIPSLNTGIISDLDKTLASEDITLISSTRVGENRVMFSDLTQVKDAIKNVIREPEYHDTLFKGIEKRRESGMKFSEAISKSYFEDYLYPRNIDKEINRLTEELTQFAGKDELSEILTTMKKNYNTYDFNHAVFNSKYKDVLDNVDNPSYDYAVKFNNMLDDVYTTTGISIDGSDKLKAVKELGKIKTVVTNNTSEYLNPALNPDITKIKETQYKFLAEKKAKSMAKIIGEENTAVDPYSVVDLASDYSTGINEKASWLWSKLGSIGLKKAQEATAIYIKQEEQIQSVSDLIGLNYQKFVGEFREVFAKLKKETPDINYEETFNKFKQYHKNVFASSKFMFSKTSTDMDYDPKLLAELGLTEDFAILSNKLHAITSDSLRTIGKVKKGEFSIENFRKYEDVTGSENINSLDNLIFKDNSYLDFRNDIDMIKNSDSTVAISAFPTKYTDEAKRVYDKLIQTTPEFYRDTKRYKVYDAAINEGNINAKIAEELNISVPELFKDNESSLIEFGSELGSYLKKTVLTDTLNTIGGNLKVIDSIGNSKGTVKFGIREFEKLKNHHETRYVNTRSSTEKVGPVYDAISRIASITVNTALSAFNYPALIFNLLGSVGTTPIPNQVAIITQTLKELGKSGTGLGKSWWTNGKNLESATNMLLNGEKSNPELGQALDYMFRKTVAPSEIFNKDINTGELILNNQGFVSSFSEPFKRGLAKTLESKNKITTGVDETIKSLETISEFLSVPYQMSDIVSRKVYATVLYNAIDAIRKDTVLMAKKNSDKTEWKKQLVNKLGIKAINSSFKVNNLINQLDSLGTGGNAEQKFINEYISDLTNHVLFNYRDKPQIFDAVRKHKPLAQAMVFTSYPVMHVQVIKGLIKSGLQGNWEPLVNATATTALWYSGMLAAAYVTEDGDPGSRSIGERLAKYGIDRTPYVKPLSDLITLPTRPLAGIHEGTISLLDIPISWPMSSAESLLDLQGTGSQYDYKNDLDKIKKIPVVNQIKKALKTVQEAIKE